MSEKLAAAVKSYLRIFQNYSRDFYKTLANERLPKAQKFIDDSFHISAVQEAQALVTKAEASFLEARRCSIEAKERLEAQQLLLKDARKKLDRCPREDVNYLTVVSEEHSILIQEQTLRKLCEKNEQKERELFTEYSNSVRLSHEKERERAQKTKYWSIIGSVSGTIIGFFGSSLITYYRLRQIKEIASPTVILKSIEDLQSEIQSQNNSNHEKMSKLIEEVFFNQKREEDLKTKNNESTFSFVEKPNFSHEATQQMPETNIEEIIDILIANSNQAFDDFKLSFQEQIDSMRKDFKSDIMKCVNAQRLLLQESILKEIRESTSDVMLLRNKRDSDDEQKNIECFVDEPAVSKSTYKWKDDVQLWITLTSFALLLYLVIDPKS